MHYAAFASENIFPCNVISFAWVIRTGTISLTLELSLSNTTHLFESVLPNHFDEFLLLSFSI